MNKKCIFIEILRNRGGIQFERQTSSSEKIPKQFFKILLAAEQSENFLYTLFIHKIKVFLKLFSTLKIINKFRKYIQGVLYLVFLKKLALFLLFQAIV